MSTQKHPTIHRHLDAIFADVPLTPEAQDLKEEMRGNLSARVAELEAEGLSPAKAAQKAIEELGDTDELLGSFRQSGAASDTTLAAYRANKVRPRPAFVLRLAGLGTIALAAIVLVTFAATNLLHWGVGVQVALAIVAVALPCGVIVGDSMRQETTGLYRLPAPRAAGYGVATGLGIVGLAMGLVIADVPSELWPLAVGVPLVVLSGLTFTFLGTTQTNRRKAWVRELENRQREADRFEKDPAAAARFGIYAGVIWMVATAAFVVMTLTIGALWALLAFLVAIIATMLMLARMEYGPTTKKD